MILLIHEKESEKYPDFNQQLADVKIYSGTGLSDLNKIPADKVCFVIPERAEHPVIPSINSERTASVFIFSQASSDSKKMVDGSGRTPIFIGFRPENGAELNRYLEFARCVLGSLKSSETKLSPADADDTPGILVIDDDEVILDLISDLLQKRNARVFTADNGEMAIEIFKESIDIINIVILDLIMPGMNGREVFRILRALKPGVKIILTTGLQQSKVQAELADLGLDGFLPKPFTILEFHSLIDRLSS